MAIALAGVASLGNDAVFRERDADQFPEWPSVIWPIDIRNG